MIKQPGMSNADYLRMLRQRAIELGKCYTCRCRPVRIGARYCDECIKRSDANTKSAAARRLCINCYCNLPRGWNKLNCPSCEHVDRERSAERKAARIAAGLCSQCGKLTASPGHRRCLACNEEGRLRQLAYNRTVGMSSSPTSCSICVQLGLNGANHTKRTHARYAALRAQWSTP